ncbi:MAG: membrane-associated phospholipid phosphatase [Psychromonas sp.]|jgi:membrane-associated phospholipid phosphatase
MKLFAQIISWVFVPLFMPIYALLILMYIPSREDYLINDDSLYFLPDQVKIALLIVFFIFSIVAPGLTLLLLKSRNIISNIEIDNKKERLIPLLITAGFCLILFLFFIVKSGSVLPKYIYALPMAGFITISLFAWINFYTKISLHGCGAGILTGVIFAYCANSIEFHYSLLLIAIFIGGLVMSSRVFLNKHTLNQVLYGYLGSAVIVYFICFFYPAGY